MSAIDDRRPVSVVLRALLAGAQGLPPGDGEREVQACARGLAAACTRRAGIRAAVDRLAGSLAHLEGDLRAGTRRRHQRDTPVVRRLQTTLSEDLLPSLRQRGLL